MQNLNLVKQLVSCVISAGFVYCLWEISNWRRQYVKVRAHPCLSEANDTAAKVSSLLISIILLVTLSHHFVVS